jgi:hypothetical protein
MNLHIDRRALLGIFAVAPIAACTAQQQAQVASVTSDADVIAQALAALLPTVATLTGLAGTALKNVQTGIANVQSAAAALDSAVSGGAASAAQLLSSGLSAVVTGLSGISVPSWVSTALAMAQTLLPVALQVAGVLTPLAPAPGGATAAQARAYLRAVPAIAAAR